MNNYSPLSESVVLKGIASNILQMSKPSIQEFNKLIEEFGYKLQPINTQTKEPSDWYQDNAELNKALHWWNTLSEESKITTASYYYVGYHLNSLANSSILHIYRNMK